MNNRNQKKIGVFFQICIFKFLVFEACSRDRYSPLPCSHVQTQPGKDQRIRALGEVTFISKLLMIVCFYYKFIILVLINRRLIHNCFFLPFSWNITAALLLTSHNHTHTLLSFYSLSMWIRIFSIQAIVPTLST